jgi:hypothetical protein
VQEKDLAFTDGGTIDGDLQKQSWQHHAATH